MLILPPSEPSEHKQEIKESSLNITEPSNTTEQENNQDTQNSDTHASNSPFNTVGQSFSGFSKPQSISSVFGSLSNNSNDNRSVFFGCDTKSRSSQPFNPAKLFAASANSSKTNHNISNNLTSLPGFNKPSSDQKQMDVNDKSKSYFNFNITKRYWCYLLHKF